MAKTGLWMLIAENAGTILGAAYSTDVTVLRLFGAEYVNDWRPVASLTLYDPAGRPFEQLNMRTGDWTKVGEHVALA